MRHTYKITGMTCNGCRSHVEETLQKIEGVTKAMVDLDKAEAIIEMEHHLSLEILKEALENDGSNYQIHLPGNALHHISEIKKEKPLGQGTGVFYCPMHCEGDKTYHEQGDCPVCGMNLVEELQSFQQGKVQYTCPMHPEVVKDDPGDCPICGMELVARQADNSSEVTAYKKLLKKFKIAAVFTVPIFLIAMSEMIPSRPLEGILELEEWNWIQFALSLPVVFYATWMFFKRAYRSIVTWNLNMFTLIGIGAGVAWGFSVFGMLVPGFFPEQFKTEVGTVPMYFEAATVILTLVLLGQLLEARAHKKTSGAVKELLKLAPNDAIRIVNGIDERIPIDHIHVGDLLRVKPGGKVPVDGILMEGASSIDEAMISGEPNPVSKQPGDTVTSGTINGKQSFVMKAEKVGADTLLSQIIEMVNTASRSRAPIQKLADRISQYFVPVVVIISVLTFVAWAVFGPEPAYVYALVNAIAVLIIACPCALGLATPMSVMVGVGKGAQSGVLIKNAEALEQMARVNTLIIDKTGTITEGKPSVEEVVVVDDYFPKNTVLQYLISVNQLSEHPLAEAMVRYGEAQHIELLKVKDFSSVTGKGAFGTVDGKNVAIGNSKMMEETGANISEKLKNKVVQQQKLGKTVSFFAINKQVVGYVVIRDKIKDSSKNAIDVLKKKGIEVIMLTGDTLNTAKAVANSLSLEHFKADMLPKDKLIEVAKLQAKGRVVAMAGDGVNDAPALAKSDVGIAMGTGTDVAIESAAITLVKGDLHGIVKAYRLSHQVMLNIRQNLFFALIYNTLGVPVAAGILFPFFGILLSPMIAALAMSFSSVSVIANALRLRNFSNN